MGEDEESDEPKTEHHSERERSFMAYESFKKRHGSAWEAFHAATSAAAQWEAIPKQDPEKQERAAYVFALVQTVGRWLLEEFDSIDATRAAQISREFRSFQKESPEDFKRGHELTVTLGRLLQYLQDVDRIYKKMCPIFNDHPHDRYLTAALAVMRISAGLTQADLAQRLGITEGAVRHIETGRTRLTIAKLYSWSTACEGHATILLTEYDWRHDLGKLWSAILGMEHTAQVDMLSFVEHWAASTDAQRRVLMPVIEQLFQAAHELSKPNP